MEAPVCECPLQDTVSTAGTDVLLKCVIAGTPLPEGRQQNSEIINISICVLFFNTEFPFSGVAYMVPCYDPYDPI